MAKVIEIARVPDKETSIRLSSTLEEWLEGFKGTLFDQLKTYVLLPDGARSSVTRRASTGDRLKCLCDLASDSGSYIRAKSASENQWLKTSITLNSATDVFSCEEFQPESHVMPRVTFFRSVQSNFSIRSNVLPCYAYLETLLAVNGGDPCHLKERRFFSYGILEDVQTSLTTVIKDWRDRNEKCNLAAQLESVQKAEAGGQETRPKTYELETIESSHLQNVRTIASIGGVPVVEEVLWHYGTFARKSFQLHEVDIEKFEREKDIAKKLSDPQVVYSFGWSFNGEKFSLLMERLDQDLWSFLFSSVSSRGKYREPPLSLQHSLEILLHVAQAMKYLHHVNVVHGDLKSANILVSEFEVAEKDKFLLVKVADFGDAKVVNTSDPFLPSKGTTKYAAPEVLKCRHLLTRSELKDPYKVDVYSFGIIAYEVLTGLVPYSDLNLDPRLNQNELQQRVQEGTLRPRLREACNEFQSRYPEDLLSLVEKCWSPEPFSRPGFSEISVVIAALKKKLCEDSSGLARCKNRKWLMDYNI